MKFETKGFNSRKEYERERHLVAEGPETHLGEVTTELLMHRRIEGFRLTLNVTNDPDHALKRAFKNVTSVEQALGLGAEIDTEPPPVSSGA